MMKFRTIPLASVALLVLLAPAAESAPINRCVRLTHDPASGRETIVNVCGECVMAKVERRRPGSVTGTPSMRDYTLPPGTKLTLPFRGPGQTRIVSELPCQQPQ